jgi:cobyrinic acid a,c-diamide synthase
MELPERHLGLVPTQESKDLTSFINKVVERIEEYIDLEKIFNIAKSSSNLDYNNKRLYNVNTDKKKYNVKIGIAYDQAFNFYYQYNLDLFKEAGAELVYFSPIKDKKLPDVDGLYIGGGFPESFLSELSENIIMKNSILEKVRSGLPTYAECGGLMYLTEKIVDFSGEEYSMVGILTARVMMKDRLQAMGYVEIEAIKNNILLNSGEKARGHEFHYSELIELENKEEIEYYYQVKGSKKSKSKKSRNKKISSNNSKNKYEGFSTKNNLLASYVHLHFASNPNLIENFLVYIKKFSNAKDK